MKRNTTEKTHRAVPKPTHITDFDQYRIRQVTDKEKAPQNATVAIVTFQPQVPIDNRLHDTDDNWVFTVPIEDAVDTDNQILESDTHQSDSLISHDNAPTNIIEPYTQELNWPFRITVEAVLIPKEEENE